MSRLDAEADTVKSIFPTYGLGFFTQYFIYIYIYIGPLTHEVARGVYQLVYARRLAFG